MNLVDLFTGYEHSFIKNIQGKLKDSLPYLFSIQNIPSYFIVIRIFPEPMFRFVFITFAVIYRNSVATTYEIYNIHFIGVPYRRDFLRPDRFGISPKKR